MCGLCYHYPVLKNGFDSKKLILSLEEEVLVSTLANDAQKRDEAVLLHYVKFRL